MPAEVRSVGRSAARGLFDTESSARLCLGDGESSTPRDVSYAAPLIGGKEGGE